MREGIKGVWFSSSITTSRKEFIRGRGRPSFLNEEQIRYAVELYLCESLSVRDIADMLGVSHMCVWRALNKISDTNINPEYSPKETMEVVVPCR